jgi:hypothetical protein
MGRFWTWLVWLLVASTVGYVATVLTAPAGSGYDPFDSPLLLPAIGVLAVLCGMAGWYVPRAGLLWGVVVAVPYVGGLLVQLAVQDGGGASFAMLGFGILAFLLVVPWLAGILTSVVARRR